MAIDCEYFPPSHDDELTRLKARTAELEALNHDLCERVTENDEIRLHWEEIEQTRAENERMKEALHRLSCNADCCYRVQFKSTKRVLWLARANYCHNFRIDWYLSRHPHSKMSQSVMENTLIMAEMNCRNKAKEYE